MKTVLCFGDSNTHGSTTEYIGRYEYEERWTIILKKLLGEDYYVIEEGLGGRTTVFDDPYSPGRSGIKAIDAIMQTHKPVDLVIIMLGTNDTKQVYNASVKSSAYGIEMIIDRIRKAEAGEPKILIVSPPLIGEKVAESRFEGFDATAHQKSLEFAKWYNRTAEKTNSYFFDSAKVAHVGSDYLHLSKESHEALAESLCPVVKKILA